MAEKIIHIEGMSCDHCVSRVQKALEGNPLYASILKSEEPNTSSTIRKRG
ncbi:hypothetical protein GM661_03370 [Iocasia frigidifontis]|uniref:Copper chaperone n=1 Tax=Iocasia fonsfrigidae TaxID=2682810 RepID=A0A8A7KFZ6_9FIRM|nr:cation transporter [Iocasia fonsfrigidae]QTL97084.1 hypothetical protein GM661_03370 [Iocasia fonsfrigidae]